MMTNIEKYTLLFVDTLFSNFILFAQNGFAFTAMGNFAYPKFYVWLVTMLSLLLASSANYLFGWLLSNIFASEKFDTKLYLHYRQMWSKYYIIIFCLALLPLFVQLSVAICGFMRFKFLRSIVLGIVMQVFYYSQLI